MVKSVENNQLEDIVFDFAVHDLLLCMTLFNYFNGISVYKDGQLSVDADKLDQANRNKLFKKFMRDLVKQGVLEKNKDTGEVVLDNVSAHIIYSALKSATESILTRNKQPIVLNVDNSSQSKLD